MLQTDLNKVFSLKNISFSPKRVYKQIPFALLLLMLSACQKDTVSDSQKASPNLTDSGDSLRQQENKTTIIQENEVQSPGLQYITEPVNVEGCSCVFAKSWEELQQKKYVYQDDYGNKAYLQFNGKIVEFPLPEEEFDLTSFQKNVSKRGFHLKISTKNLGKDPEVHQYSGTMEVTAPDKSKTNTPIVGECGC